MDQQEHHPRALPTPSRARWQLSLSLFNLTAFISVNHLFMSCMSGSSKNGAGPCFGGLKFLVCAFLSVKISCRATLYKAPPGAEDSLAFQRKLFQQRWLSKYPCEMRGVLWNVSRGSRQRLGKCRTDLWTPQLCSRNRFWESSSPFWHCSWSPHPNHD